MVVKWFCTCFLDSNSNQLSLCVMDMLMIGVPDALIRVGLGIMARLEAVILRCPIEEVSFIYR